MTGFGKLLIIVLAITAPASAMAEVISIGPEEARNKAIAGEIVMIDIRSFEEVAESGILDVALLVDKFAPGFTQKLIAIQAQAQSTPIAVFYRRGGCADDLEADLLAIGFSGVYDVLGGFYGSDLDAGWGKRVLPIRTIDMGVNTKVPLTQP